MGLKLKALAKYAPIIVFIAVSVLVGEEHPFTRFPMYAKFPEAIDYYFLMDENGQPVSGLKQFSFTVSQIKDEMGAYLRTNGNTPQNERQAAQEILNNIGNSDKGTAYFKTHGQLSVVRKNLHLDGKHIVETDSVLVTWQP